LTTKTSQLYNLFYTYNNHFQLLTTKISYNFLKELNSYNTINIKLILSFKLFSIKFVI